MVNEIKKNGEVIKNHLIGNDNLSISDMVRQLTLSRGQIRVAVAYLLGASEVIEFKYGMAKVYSLK